MSPEVVEDCVNKLLRKEDFYPDRNEEERKRLAWAICTKQYNEGKLRSNTNWVKKEGVLEIAGLYEYDDRYEQKVADEFAKTIEYFDSVPIVYGTDHPSIFTLKDVIGKATNFRIVDNKWEADFLFDWSKMPDDLVFALNNNDYIPASMGEWVRVEDNVHRDIVPVHLLVHPQLEPRIQGAGIRNNTKTNYIQFRNIEIKENNICNKKVKGDTMADVNVEELKSQIEALQRENTALRKVLKDELIKEITNTKMYSEEDIKDKSIEELQIIRDTLTKIVHNTKNDPIKVAENTKSVDFWDIYKQRYGGNV